MRKSLQSGNHSVIRTISSHSFPWFVCFTAISSKNDDFTSTNCTKLATCFRCILIEHSGASSLPCLYSSHSITCFALPVTSHSHTKMDDRRKHFIHKGKIEPKAYRKVLRSVSISTGYLKFLSKIHLNHFTPSDIKVDSNNFSETLKSTYNYRFTQSMNQSRTIYNLNSDWLFLSGTSQLNTTLQK